MRRKTIIRDAIKDFDVQGKEAREYLRRISMVQKYVFMIYDLYETHFNNYPKKTSSV